MPPQRAQQAQQAVRMARRARARRAMRRRRRAGGAWPPWLSARRPRSLRCASSGPTSWLSRRWMPSTSSLPLTSVFPPAVHGRSLLLLGRGVDVGRCALLGCWRHRHALPTWLHCCSCRTHASHRCACPSALFPCRRDGGIFTAGYEEGQSPEQAAAAAAAAGPPAPSPPMLLAADSLQQLLRALAQHLDAVVFR